MLSIFIPFKPSFSFSKDIKRNSYLIDFCGHNRVGSGEIPSLGYLWNPTPGVIHVLGDCESFYLPGSPGLSLHTKLWSGLHQALSVSTIPYNSALLCLLDFKDFWFVSVRPRPLLFSPRKREMNELHSDFLSLQVLLTNTGPSRAELIQWFLVPHPFLSTQYFCNWNQVPVHTAGGKQIDPKLVVKAVTGWNFTSGGISPEFPKLYKKISVQCELKLCWFFNFCIYKGDSNGQSKRSCNQSFFCSHPVPQVMNTFHTKSAQSVCPDRLYYLYLCNTL